MTKRKHRTRLQRRRIYDDANGICCLCNLPIKAEIGVLWILEHLTPLWLGGADDESNIRPAHQSCAIKKTCAEAPVKAKSDRVRAKYLGIKKPRKSSWGYGKGDRRKKKITGEVVMRD